MKLLVALLAAMLPWTQTSAALHEYAASAAQLGRFSGVVLVARGSDVYREAFGFSNVSRGTRNTVSTQFEIASLTKMFTAAAVLKLRDDGRLKLGDTLCSHLASCPQQWRTVTLDQTLHHRSGIPDYEDDLGMESDAYYAFMTQPDHVQRSIEREWNKPLDFPPGSKFSYSNTGYVLLAYVIQNASHESYARYLHEKILGPAGMTHTGILDVDTPQDLAVGYAAPDVTWAQRLAAFSLDAVGAKPVPSIKWGALHGDAALFSNADDLYRWAQVMMGRGPAIFSSAERSEIFQEQDGYGDGWMIGDQFGLKRYRHTGQVPGYLSSIAIYPERDTVVIMLDNLDTPMLATTRDINAIAVGAPYDMPVRGTVVDLPADQLQRFTGAYEFDDKTIGCVTVEKTRLAMAVPDRYHAGLIPLGGATFYMPLSSGTVTFTDSGLVQRYNGEDRVARRVDRRVAASCAPQGR